MVRYAFTVRDSHPLLLAGLPAHIGFVSDSACPTTERSKRRAIRPNWSPALAKRAPGVSGSAETPARALAAAKRSMAAFVAAALSRCSVSIISAGDVTGVRHRYDGIIEEGDPGDVRAKGCGDGDGVVFGGACPFTDAKIDDDFFDHSGVSPVRAARVRSFSRARKSDRLGKGNELPFAELHRVTKLVVIDRTAKDGRQPFGGAE